MLIVKDRYKISVIILCLLSPFPLQCLDTVKEKEITGKKAYVSKRIACELCQRKFNKKETYSKHLKQAHGETSRNEENIESTMTFRKTLRSHKTTSRALKSIN